MSRIDQCPSTKDSVEVPGSAPEPGTVSGRAYWRSLEEYTGTPEFKEFVEREFPGGASLLGESSRRSFLKVMGASLAIAGAATIPGCRRPDRKILPYSKDVPEQVVPGRPLYFATALPLPGGGVEGLLVETHTGRPTKVEGNPNHPVNRGKSSAWAQARVLDLYDPDRLKYPVFNNEARGRLPATWDDFDAWAENHFVRFDESDGRGLAFVIDKRTSPTREQMVAKIRMRWPGAMIVPWDPSGSRTVAEGSGALLGRGHWARYNLGDAERVVSIGTGHLDTHPEALRMARGLAEGRRVDGDRAEMSRVYAVEPKPTQIGAIADHRFRVAPSQLRNFVLALARNILVREGVRPDVRETARLLVDTEVAGMSAREIDAIADDLWAHRGRAVLLPSDELDAASWAMCMVVNEALGAMRASIVEFYPMEPVSQVDASGALSALVDLMGKGEVDTLVCVETNPLYDAPGGSGFAEAFSKVGTTITLSVGASETEGASTWSLNAAHPFEAWNTAGAIDGSISVVQPLIAPLYDGARSDIELLDTIANAGSLTSERAEGYTLVRGSLRDIMGLGETGLGDTGLGDTGLGEDAFEARWREGLHSGVLTPARSTPSATNAMRSELIVRSLGGVGRSNAAPGPSHLDVVFYTDQRQDGAGANNGWLQELPEFGPSVVWDNPLLVSPETAKALGVLPEHSSLDEYNPYTKSQMPQARLAEIELDGRSMTMPVWILPGMADNTVGVKLGYGRTRVGRVGDGVGFNTYALRGGGAAIARGATITKAGGTYTIASTQNHWSMESRTSIVRAMDASWYNSHAPKGPIEKPDDIYEGYASTLSVAEKLGELSHTPPNVGAYENPLNESRTDAAPGSRFSQGPQWGMSIDLNSCVGCHACTVACQSENNIPVVGKSEVAKGREMHWIRVDRYFVGEDLNDPDEIYAQPVACVHCENAPCETVCPVNATVHGPEGTNDIAYNRCIGTRYCANNCPYKVRRFNFFDYSPAKFNGGLDPNYVSKELSEAFDEGIGRDRTFNQNLIPPRLREKLDEISKMKYNPDVTVRSRGVIEKCTYCIQRVNQARQDAKIRGVWTQSGQAAPIPDGFFQVACQQACPTDAIAFGDILDPDARVTKERDSQRTYQLLGYLNTRPRTTYMMRVRNPNPEIRVYDEHDPLSHGHGGESHGESHDKGHGNEHGNEHDGAHDSNAAHGNAASFRDPIKRYTDQGYALSLRVLGAQA